MTKRRQTKIKRRQLKSKKKTNNNQKRQKQTKKRQTRHKRQKLDGGGVTQSKGIVMQEELNNIPILVVGNKIDIKPHLSQEELIERLNLDYLTTNPWAILMISALKGDNIP